jgi:uncharacterized protein (TIGR03435 family)
VAGLLVRNRWWMLLPAAALMFAAMPGFGQSDTARGGVIAKPVLAFDVVSIKANKSNGHDYTMELPAGGDGVVITNVNLYAIVRFAYDFYRQDLISGVPAWAETERYDIQAKVAGTDVAAWRGMKDSERRLMLQAVLTERFGLKAHWESREVGVHALVVAKGGPKIRESKPGETGELTDANGKPVQGILHTGPGQETAQGASMAELALELSDYTGRQVIDKTGLAGVYDFKLQFTPEPGFGPEYRRQRQQAAPLPEFTGPTIFTAVQEQLGLKLEAAKLPVNGLAIDHLERPAGN